MNDPPFTSSELQRRDAHRRFTLARLEGKALTGPSIFSEQPPDFPKKKKSKKRKKKRMNNQNGKKVQGWRRKKKKRNVRHNRQREAGVFSRLISGIGRLFLGKH
jgi:hypothetical protein